MFTIGSKRIKSSISRNDHECTTLFPQITCWFYRLTTTKRFQEEWNGCSIKLKQTQENEFHMIEQWGEIHTVGALKQHRGATLIQAQLEVRITRQMIKPTTWNRSEVHHSVHHWSPRIDRHSSNRCHMS